MDMSTFPLKAYLFSGDEDIELKNAGTIVAGQSRDNFAPNWAEGLDIQMILEGEEPKAPFYSVPFLNIFATDSQGGFFAGGDLADPSRVYYIAADWTVFRVADTLEDFLANKKRCIEEKRKVPSEEVTIYPSLAEAKKELEFVELPQEEAKHWKDFFDNPAAHDPR